MAVTRGSGASDRPPQRRTTSTTRPRRATTTTVPSGGGGLLSTIPTVTLPPDDEPPKYSTADPRTATNHAIVSEWLKNNGLSSSVAGDFANDLASDFFRREGRWPSPAELLSDPSTQNRMTWASQGLYLLPPVFGVRGPDGIEYFTNDPNGGLVPIDTSGGVSRTFSFGNVPIFNPGDIDAILGTAQEGGGGGGRGGGGGGGGRAPAVFDREQLIAAAIQTWRGRLLEEPDNVESLVDEYIQKANSFWMSKGGQLDFETFILGKAEATPRHKMLYARKPESMTHDQYLGQYVQAVRALGVSERTAMREVEAGASVGASAAGFSERLETLPEVVAGNQGTFSQRFAAQIAQLGVRGT